MKIHRILLSGLKQIVVAAVTVILLIVVLVAARILFPIGYFYVGGAILAAAIVWGAIHALNRASAKPPVDEPDRPPG